MKSNIIRKQLSFIFLYFLLQVNVSLLAQTQTKENIFDTLSKPDSITGASVKFNQDKRIEDLVNRSSNSSVSQIATTTIPGYRVQVFSSNTQRTAKSEAFKIEKELRELFPEISIYVSYTSPFWKVRVGDFTQLSDAQSFKNELINVFPNFKSETYTVKDQIVVPK